jgi:hypothetical protein
MLRTPAVGAHLGERIDTRTGLHERFGGKSPIAWKIGKLALPMKPVAERIVFLAGLHRSGTTPLASWLAMHPQVSNLKGTGVYADEGQHLQSVYPPGTEHGGAGRFALDPEAYLDADSRFARPDAQTQLIAAWSPYWDLSCEVLLEKSPPNLIRMPFLKAVFPDARFIVIVRHPLAVAVATSKWTGASMDTLLRNWVRAYESCLEKARRVEPLALLRYEDLMADPESELSRLFEFLSLPAYAGSWPVQSGVNDQYFTQLRGRSHLRWRLTRSLVTRRYEAVASRFGYSLRAPETLSSPAPEVSALMR